jgi:hypothetical protein
MENIPLVDIDSSSFYMKKDRPIGKLIVFSVCITKYTDLPPLPNAHANIQTLVQIIRANEVKIQKCFTEIVLKEPLMDATYDQIVNSLNSLIAATDEKDCILLYFTGHGVIPPGSELFYFVPSDGVVQGTDSERNCLNTAHFIDLMTMLRCRRKILLVDACQSGAIISSLAKVVSSIPSKKQHYPNSIAVIASSLPIEYSNQYSNGSYFMQLLDKTLRSLGNSAVVNLSDIIRVMKNIDEKNTGKPPIQTPLFVVNGADFPILRN